MDEDRKGCNGITVDDEGVKGVKASSEDAFLSSLYATTVYS